MGRHDSHRGLRRRRPGCRRAGLAAVTALEGLRRLQLRPGQRVAVHGAGGGVGSAAVSLARRAGAEVIAVVSRAGQDAYVRSLGAAEVLVLTEGTTLVDALGARMGQESNRSSVLIATRGTYTTSTPTS